MTTQEVSDLTALQIDALTELLNIGIGRGAAGLSELIGQEVMLSVPSVSIVSQHELSDSLEEELNEKLSCIQQSFFGSFSGKALLVFPQTETKLLAKAILEANGIAFSDEDMEQTFEDPLVEMGNILINACLGSLANIFEEELIQGKPEILSGESGYVVNKVSSGTLMMRDVIVIHINLTLTELDIKGSIVFLLAIGSVEGLQEVIDRYMGM